MEKKKIWIIALALVALIGAMAALYISTRAETSTAEKAITITVVHADGSERGFAYNTEAETLGQALRELEIVEGEESEYGLMIHAVDGEAASWEANQSYWAILIGEEYAVEGADFIALTDGGEYSLVYTIG